MSVVFVLIIIGIFVASIFLVAFIWAVKSGQFDDSYTPAVRILFDDTISVEKETPLSTEKNQNKKSNKS